MLRLISIIIPETGGLMWVQNQPGLHSRYQTCQDSTARLWLKIKQKDMGKGLLISNTLSKNWFRCWHTVVFWGIRSQYLGNFWENCPVLPSFLQMAQSFKPDLTDLAPGASSSTLWYISTGQDHHGEWPQLTHTLRCPFRAPCSCSVACSGHLSGSGLLLPVHRSF